MQDLLLILLVSTIAGFYGSIFGGGAFLIFAVLFVLGVDPKIVIGTNFAAASGYVLASSFVFYRKKEFDLHTIKKMMPFVFLGALVGLFILIKSNGELIKTLVTFVIITLAIVGLIHPQSMLSGQKIRSKKHQIAGYISSFLVGIYQTTLTAGTGTIKAFILVHFFGLKLKTAIATRPFISIPTFILSISVFAWHGLIDWVLFVPMFIGRALGSYVGAHTVLKMKSNILVILFNIAVVTLALYSCISSFNNVTQRGI